MLVCRPKPKRILKSFLHLPVIQTFKHLAVFYKIWKILKDGGIEDNCQIEEQSKKKESAEKQVAAIDNDFQEFKILETMCESVPQAVLQIGIVIREQMKFRNPSRLALFSNVTVLSSLISCVATFTGVFIKKTDWFAKKEDLKERANQINTALIKSKKAYFLIGPLFFGTAAFCITSLGCAIATRKYLELLILLACYFLVQMSVTFVLQCFLNIELPERRVLPLMWAMFLVCPCIRTNRGPRRFSFFNAVIIFFFVCHMAVQVLRDAKSGPGPMR